MELAIIDDKGAAAGRNVGVSDSTFGADYNEALIHQVVVAYMAGARPLFRLIANPITNLLWVDHGKSLRHNLDNQVHHKLSQFLPDGVMGKSRMQKGLVSALRMVCARTTGSNLGEQKEEKLWEK